MTRIKTKSWETNQSDRKTLHPRKSAQSAGSLSYGHLAALLDLDRPIGLCTDRRAAAPDLAATMLSAVRSALTLPTVANTSGIGVDGKQQSERLERQTHGRRNRQSSQP